MKTLFKLSLLVWLVVTVYSCTEQGTPVVAIQPLGTVSDAQINLVKEALDSIYDVRVVVLPANPPFKEAFTPLKGTRYRADTTIAC